MVKITVGHYIVKAVHLQVFLGAFPGLKKKNFITDPKFLTDIGLLVILPPRPARFLLASTR